MALAPGELAAAATARGGLNGVRAMLADHGLEVPELEPLRGWDGDDAEAAGESEEAIHALAEAFGSSRVTAIQVVSDEVPAELVVERFAAVCDRAAEHGLAVGFEPRSSSPVARPAAAAELIRAAGRRNSGIVLDAYHLHREQVTLEEIAAVAPLVLAVQLNDTTAAPLPPPANDALDNRLAPGEGDLDLPAWLAGLARLGIDVPLAVEVLSREFRELPVEAAATRAAEGARAALAAARGVAHGESR